MYDIRSVAELLGDFSVCGSSRIQVYLKIYQYMADKAGLRNFIFVDFCQEKSFHFNQIALMQSYIGRSWTHLDQLFWAPEPCSGLALEGLARWLYTFGKLKSMKNRVWPMSVWAHRAELRAKNYGSKLILRVVYMCMISGQLQNFLVVFKFVEVLGSKDISNSLYTC